MARRVRLRLGRRLRVRVWEAHGTQTTSRVYGCGGSSEARCGLTCSGTRRLQIDYYHGDEVAIQAEPSGRMSAAIESLLGVVIHIGGKCERAPTLVNREPASEVAACQDARGLKDILDTLY